jgi:hypothetical protein
LRKRSGPAKPDFWLEKLKHQNQVKRMWDREDQVEVFRHYYKPVKLMGSDGMTKNLQISENTVEDNTQNPPIMADDASRLEFGYDT